MATLGSTFLKTALAPLHFANVSVMGRIITTALREVAAENLRNELRSAIKKTAHGAGVRALDIQRLLPMDRFEAIAALIDRSQNAAVEAWRDQPVASRRARDLASLTIGGGMPNLHESLERLAQQEGPETPLGAAFAALADAIRQWQELILQTGNKLDDDRVLAGAYRRRVLRRVLLGLVLLACAGGGVWFWQRIEHARGRVNAHIGSADPCAVSGIEPLDLERATAEQRTLVDRRKQECSEQQAREEAARKEREKRAAYEKGCADLARELAQGKPAMISAASKKQAALLERVAKGSLEDEDFGPKDPDFPCKDTPSHTALNAAFDKAVVGSKGWIQATELSQRVRTLLAAQADKLPDAVKDEVDELAEQTAVKALVANTAYHLRRAKHLCDLKTALERERGKFCRALPK